MRLFLADLGHNLLTKSSDVYPLGVANLATFAQAHLPELALEVSIFREPQDLKRALDAGAPDVLGTLELRLERGALEPLRAVREGALVRSTLVVMGGPNYPLVDRARGTVPARPAGGRRVRRRADLRGRARVP
jgi:hypothetical protein